MISQTLDNEILPHLQNLADNNGHLSYFDFIQAALYTPNIGYYMRDKQRVGTAKGTDFYTSESLATPTFAELILSATQSLLPNENLSDYSFIEFGAEPNNHLLNSLESHPFKDSNVFRPNQNFTIPQKSILFANELLDAQPFHRFLYKSGKWHERGIKIENNTLTDCILPTPSPIAQQYLHRLPKVSAENYQLDFPTGAEILFKNILSQNFTGAILFLDYGTSWQALTTETPQGSARAYSNHTQHNDILKNPTHQDITHHIHWDVLETIAQEANFKNPTTLRQEAFFLKHSTPAIQKIIEADPTQFSQDKQALQQLLHPAHMGSKFQVLSAVRHS